jgi:hypothetical protein
MTRLKQEYKINKDEAGNEFYKLILNNSYGHNILNKEIFKV